MLPQFPQFKKIELSDRANIEAHTNKYEPYSDFNFTCLWCWDKDEARAISELNGNLVVKFTDYHTHVPFLSFLGSNRCEETAVSLFEYCKKNDIQAVLRFMTDVSISGLDSEKFIIEESRRDFDYILSTKRYTQLINSESTSKRITNSKKFWKENSTAICTEVNLNDSSIRKQILGVISMWEQRKITNKKEYELSHELNATKRLFEINNLSPLSCIAIYLNGSMIGYEIHEKFNNGFAMGHFLKCIPDYEGINDALLCEYSKELYLNNILFLNIESDLDSFEMRNYKTSLRPVKYLKRYNVNLNYPQ